MSRTFTDEQVKDISIRYLTLFRKMCHLLIYLVLGVFVAAAFKNFTKLKFPAIIILTIISCFIYSLTDEYHQTFVLGRGGSIVDCLIDTSGSLIGSFIYMGLHLTKEKFKAKIKAKKKQKLQKQE
jgi:VanZ family protein